MNLSATIADFFYRHHLQSTAGIVAVSGGPDSVALAHLLVAHLQEGALPRLILAHVNHQLRGEESDADADFVLRLPQHWQMANDPRLSCRTVCIDTAAKAKAEKANLEALARHERYAWLADLARAEGAAWVATGHTADDQAETVLFRLLRGSGVLGLGGMHECRPLCANATLIRPCLTLRRQSLLDYLHANATRYRIDSSNRDMVFARNRLRRELMPLLEHSYNPALTEVLCRLAVQAQELHQDITRQAAELLTEAELPRANNILVLCADRLKTVSPNLLREMFRIVWQREDWPMGDMDFHRWNRLVEIVHKERPAMDFPGNIHARRVGNVVQIISPI